MDNNISLFRLSVTETECDREYWVTRSWVSPELVERIRAADVLIVPWENFREGHPAQFPQGTTDFFRAMNNSIQGKQVGIAVEQSQYEEVVLHANRVRWPTIFVSSLLFPTLATFLGELAMKRVEDHVKTPVVSVKVIVEGRRGHCIEIDYAGPANDLASTLVNQAEKCLPRIESKPRPMPKPPESAAKR